MRYRIKNWREYQHYKGRNPPWIKLHSQALASKDWVTLADASRLAMIVCMIMASLDKEGDGSFDGDPEYMQRYARLDVTPDLQPLVNSGFLELVEPNASKCLQVLASASPSVSVSVSDSSLEGGVGETITLAAELAQEFHFRIPGTSKPMLPDLTAEFQAKLDWLAAHGRDVAEHIRGCIKDPKRDKTASNTIGKMWKFWEFCGLLENNDGKQRNSNAGGSPKHSAGGGRYEGLLPRLVKDDA